MSANAPDEALLHPRASLWLRLTARLLDLLLALILYRSTGPLGIVLALVYLAFADGLLQGQSIGKKACGVKVIHLPSRSPARFRDSVLRNAPFALVVLLGMMPDVGETAFMAGALVIGGVESYRCVRDAHGIRLGDVWAQTQVIDGKVLAGQTLARPPSAVGADGRAMLEAAELATRRRSISSGREGT